MSEHVAWCRYQPAKGDSTKIVLCDSDAPGAFRVYRVKHKGDCEQDAHSRLVCEGVYEEKCDDVIALCRVLRAVRTLAGENPEVLKLIDEVLEEHGGMFAST